MASICTSALVFCFSASVNYISLDDVESIQSSVLAELAAQRQQFSNQQQLMPAVSNRQLRNRQQEQSSTSNSKNKQFGEGGDRRGF